MNASLRNPLTGGWLTIRLSQPDIGGPVRWELCDEKTGAVLATGGTDRPLAGPACLKAAVDLAVAEIDRMGELAGRPESRVFLASTFTKRGGAWSKGKTLAEALASVRKQAGLRANARLAVTVRRAHPSSVITPDGSIEFPTGHRPSAAVHIKPGEKLTEADVPA